MKRFVGYIANKIVKSIPSKKKVSPTIKSVKPTKDIAGSVKRTYSEGYTKNIRALDKAESKIKTGKEMMKEGQKARKQMIDTGRAFQFRGRKSTHPIEPGENPKVKYKSTIAEDRPEKKFKKGKELREKKMGGGMMGRRFGMKKGTNPFKKETNVDKIKKTFAPKGLKKIDPKKQKGLAKLKKERPDVVRKMGYMKKGGRAGFKGGGADMTNVASDKTKREAKKFEKRAKAASKDVKNIGRSFTSIMNEKYRP